MLRKWVLVALSSVLLLTVSGLRAQEPVPLTFFMTFVPNVQFAPVYVALEKGYFAEQGLNVTVEHGDENVGVDLIAAGERQFGLISGEEVLKARAAGRPVVFVYEWFQQYPVGIVYNADSGLASVADLKGKKVGIPGRFGASYNGLTALLSASGLSESDIQLEPIGFNAPDVFCMGAVEAAVVYINNEPLQIQQRADAGQCGAVKNVAVFPVATAADMVSNGLVTNEQTIAEQPDLVRAVVAAFNAGLADAVNNPAEAYLLSAKYVENLPLDDAFRSALETAAQAQTAALEAAPDRAAVIESRAALREQLNAAFDPAVVVQFDVLLNTIDLWDADQLGLTDDTSWEQTAKLLVQMGALTEPYTLTGAYTNAFLPEAAQP
jgi:NitT/TauT family transport system substrate-binding protein